LPAVTEEPTAACRSPGSLDNFHKTFFTHSHLLNSGVTSVSVLRPLLFGLLLTLGLQCDGSKMCFEKSSKIQEDD
jgi:hypothetical protein